MSMIHHHSQTSLFSPKYIFTWPAFLILWLFSRLPYKALLTIGTCLGKLMYIFFSKRKYIIRTNISLCFPKKSKEEVENLVKANLKYLGIGVCDTALAWFGPKKTTEELLKKLTIQNESALIEALKENKPLILITPHASSQELLSKLLSCKYTYDPVFRHMNNPVANYMMQKARLRIYKNPILKTDTRHIVKRLRDNGTIAILPDQDFGRKRSVFVPFFGVIAATSTALSKYKKLTDCNILALGYLRNTAQDSFTITISDKLDIHGLNLDHDAKVMNTALENIILRDISMYFWIARRFKTRPAGEKKIYDYKNMSAKLNSLVN